MTLVDSQAPDRAITPPQADPPQDVRSRIDSSQMIVDALGYGPTTAECGELTRANQLHRLLSDDVRAIPVAVAMGEAFKRDDGPAGYGRLLELRRRGAATDRMLDAVEAQQGGGAIVEFRALDPTGKKGAHIIYWNTGTDRTAVRDWLRERDGLRNFYVGVNPRNADKGSTASAATDVAAVRFIVVDLDFKNATPDNPKWTRVSERLREAGPAMEVLTGNGVHFWFRVKDVTDPAAVAEFGSRVGALLRAIGSDAVGDSPRIMRLPWSINVPTERKRQRGARLALATPVAVPKPIGPARPWLDVARDIAGRFGLDFDNLPAAGHGGAGGTGPGRGLPPEVLRATTLELLRLALTLLPNGDNVSRDDQVAVAHMVRGAAQGTEFEAEARDAFLEWSARYSGADPDHDARLYDGIRSTGTGWPHLLDMLRQGNPGGHRQVLDRWTPIRNAQARAAFAGVPIPTDQQHLLASVEGTKLAAEGGQTAAPTADPEWLVDLNKRFALVEGVPGVVDTQPADGNAISVWSYIHFRTFFDGLRRVPTGRRGPQKGMGSVWLDHPKARHFRRMGYWLPGQEPPGALNLFTGLAVTPDPDPTGAKCPLTLSFIRDVIARGRTTVSNYVLDWLAWAVRNPLGKPGVNLVLVGGQGTGKSTLAEFMGELFGKANSITVNNAHTSVGRFNSHFEGKLFAVFDEAMFGRDPAVGGTYKSLTTSPELMIERKGFPVYASQNLLKIMVLSNHLSAVPVEPGDRRATIIRVSDAHKEDTAYFAALRHEQDNGGRGAFLAFLLARDLSQFDQRRSLPTPEKAEVASATADPITRWWTELLERGSPPFGTDPGSNATATDWTAGPVPVLNRDLAAEFEQWARSRRMNYVPARDEVVGRVGELCPVRGQVKRKRVNGRPEYYFEYPKLDICRAALDRALGGGS